jgi:hypothetical protein
MIDFLTIAIPSGAFALGYIAANWASASAIEAAQQEADDAFQEYVKADKLAQRNWDRFTDACKECNVIEEELVDCQASNQRLADALAAKTARLERIAEKFEGQQSGTAQLAVRMARGDA